MFMQIAIGAIGIGVVLMVAYIVISQVRSALPASSTVQIANPCLGDILEGVAPTTPCVWDFVGAAALGGADNASWSAPTICGTANLSGDNATSILTCDNVAYNTGTSAVQVTVFAGFGLVGVGIIVLAAFALINIFR